MISIRMHNILIILVIYLCLFAVFSDFSYSEVKNIKGGSTITVMPRKTNKQEKERVLKAFEKKNVDDIMLDIYPRRYETQNILKSIVKSKEHRVETRILAAQILGEIRLNYDVDILVKNMRLGYANSAEFTELDKFNFPVGYAIINIGIPARLHLLNEIKSSKDEEIIRLCAFVLMKIEDQDIAKVILEREIKKEEQINQKANLEKALSYLK